MTGEFRCEPRVRSAFPSSRPIGRVVTGGASRHCHVKKSKGTQRVSLVDRMREVCRRSARPGVNRPAAAGARSLLFTPPPGFGCGPVEHENQHSLDIKGRLWQPSDMEATGCWSMQSGEEPDLCRWLLLSHPLLVDHCKDHSAGRVGQTAETLPE
ncbi:hypothetical protein EYF80_003003 [Liparis tanakae]|uniref:Uncharacterized protein n=1 Tax=Liparis tanakae TaxID=230148 RepID=A0A4Z2J9N4_9TELE|nr:hypothetical protein EYF80_003003 [Liparis tanakae]